MSSTCGVCAENVAGVPYGWIWENDLWLLRHAPAPHGVKGWLTLQTKSHTPGPSKFSDAQAASLGPTLRHICGLLEEATGALRIYTAAMGEMHPHFHMHLVPRYEGGAKGFALFTAPNAEAATTGGVPPAEVEALVQKLRAALSASPPP